MIVSFLARRLKWFQFKQTMLETTLTTAMMVGAYIFMRFVTINKLPFFISDTITSMGLSKSGFMLAIVVFYLLLGCFMDIFGAIILTVPILMPTVNQLGIDPIWFGVIVVRLIEVGLITPPMGMDVFTFSGAMKLPVGMTFRGVTPFVISDFLHLALLIAIPKISLFLT